MAVYPQDIFVVVQTCPERRKHREPTLRSIESSDIGRRYELLEQNDDLDEPPKRGLLWGVRPARRPVGKGKRVMAHLRRVLTAMYDSGAPYALRLEDDVLVNRHVLHNLATWPALADNSFGAGWLFCSKPLLDDRMRLRFSKVSHSPYRNCREMFAALGVLLPRDMIAEVLKRLKGEQQDIGLSTAVWDAGRRCYFHLPALVENRIDVPSARGHRQSTRYHLTHGLFDADYRR